MLITPVQPQNSLNNVVTNRRPTFPPKVDSKSPEIPTPLSKIFSARQKSVKRKEKKGTSSSAAKKKILLELKLQETIRRNSKKLQSIEEHKGELVQRKQMLSDILEEYEQISKDKNILTMEIRNMKRYLSDIRTKLDQSLTVLNKNTTLFAMKRNLTNAFLISPSIKPKTSKRVKRQIKGVERKEPSMSVSNGYGKSNYK